MEDIKQFTLANDGERRTASFVNSNDEVTTYTINDEQEADAQAFLKDLADKLESEPESEGEGEGDE